MPGHATSSSADAYQQKWSLWAYYEEASVIVAIDQVLIDEIRTSIDNAKYETTPATCATSTAMKSQGLCHTAVTKILKAKVRRMVTFAPSISSPGDIASYKTQNDVPSAKHEQRNGVKIILTNRDSQIRTDTTPKPLFASLPSKWQYAFSVESNDGTLEVSTFLQSDLSSQIVYLCCIKCRIDCDGSIWYWLWPNPIYKGFLRPAWKAFVISMKAPQLRAANRKVVNTESIVPLFPWFGDLRMCSSLLIVKISFFTCCLDFRLSMDAHAK